MQSRSKILDDVSQLMTNAMGVAQGAREEAETAIKSIIDRWLADHDFVTREDTYNVVQHGVSMSTMVTLSKMTWTVTDLVI